MGGSGAAGYARHLSGLLCSRSGEEHPGPPLECSFDGNCRTAVRSGSLTHILLHIFHGGANYGGGCPFGWVITYIGLLNYASILRFLDCCYAGSRSLLRPVRANCTKKRARGPHPPRDISQSPPITTYLLRWGPPFGEGGESCAYPSKLVTAGRLKKLLHAAGRSRQYEYVEVE